MKEKRNPLKWIMKVVGKHNIADLLDKEELNEIGQTVKGEYDLDLESRADWDRQTESAMKLAKQVVEDKTFPWPNCANFKVPLMTVAALQFNARAYPELISGNQVVKCHVNGEDPDGQKEKRAQRISDHMSWQCLCEMENWEEETDRLLIMLPIIGTLFRKTYFDAILGHNRSDLLTHESVTVNHRARSLKVARRITHKYELYENDVYERVKYRPADGSSDVGIFLDVDLPAASDPDKPGDEDAPHWFLEQHRYLDLDGDGYAEPYIVTVHEETANVVRIVPNFDEDSVVVRGPEEKLELARIVPNEHFTQYSLIPNPDGGLHGVGFGQLLSPINEGINSILNQLVDAGTLNNTARGWARGLKRAGVLSFAPGEWKAMPSGASDARIDFFPLPTSEPSPILFQLLGLLIQTAQDITSVKDIMTGESPGANVPATTTLAMVEQGMKVFSAIYKRIYRSMTVEFKKLYRLNSIYMEPEQYFRFHDSEQAQKAAKSDYTMGDYDVTPVADPRLATDAQRMARAQALASTIGMPGANGPEITKAVHESIGIPNADKYSLPAEATQPPPDPRAIEIQARIQMDGQRLEMELNKHLLDIEKTIADIEHLKADTMLKIAQAEAQEVGQQFEIYRQQMDMLAQDAKMRADVIKAKIQQQTAMMKGVSSGGQGQASGAGADNVGGLGPMGPGPDNAQNSEPDLEALIAGGAGPGPGGMLPGGQPGIDGAGVLPDGGLPGRPPALS